MSSRTLRRKLRDKETTYKKIVDEVRMDLARRYLSETGLSIDQIANQVGFTEAANFRRAFKKWTGSNPTGFRKRTVSAGGPF